MCLSLYWREDVPSATGVPPANRNRVATAALAPPPRAASLPAASNHLRALAPAAKEVWATSHRKGRGSVDYVDREDDYL